MDDQKSDKRLRDLVAATRLDKEENFEQLYAELLPLVYYRALVLLNDRGEAQKVAQVCFVHLYKHIEELHDLDQFQPWLEAVIASACKGMMQARKHAHDIDTELGHDLLADMIGGSESYRPDEALEAHESDEAVWAAIQALSQKQKEVILLYYVEGLSVDDIAAVLAISYSAARSRLFKARRHLMALLEKEGEKAAVGLRSLDLNTALGRMDALILLPFLSRQLADFGSSAGFGKLATSIARLIPEHHSLLTVSAEIWSGVAREVGLLARSAPVIAGSVLSASQVAATTARAASLPGAALKLIPKLLRSASSNPVQAAVVGVASVAVVAGVAAGAVMLSRPSPPAPVAATQTQNQQSASAAAQQSEAEAAKKAAEAAAAARAAAEAAARQRAAQNSSAAASTAYQVQLPSSSAPPPLPLPHSPAHPTHPVTPPPPSIPPTSTPTTPGPWPHH
ncbi:MAG: sigma-70 family RNA polymerase sigma factor [Actinomycetia bacterium]|nr:sigma-70 family RNA polymerase sigma factor [Actinomycetes bacterium]